MAASATTEVDLANMALTMLGQQPISNLTDNNNRAKMANQRLADIRDTVLRAHNWNCATKRASLTNKDSVAPAWGYANRFALPSLFIRLVRTEDPLVDYKIESGNDTGANTLFIVTDATSVNILYIYKVTDVSKMDSTLKHAIATRLASDIAVALTGDMQQEHMLLQKYEQILMQATFEDSSAHHTMESIQGRYFLESRLGGGVYRDIDAPDAGYAYDP